jgi:hypothetical protein
MRAKFNWSWVKAEKTEGKRKLKKSDSLICTPMFIAALIKISRTEVVQVFISEWTDKQKVLST